MNGLEIFAREYPSEFGIRTTSEPTSFTYRYRFASEGGSTMIHPSAEVELGVPGLIAPLAAGGVKRGVDANLAALKQNLEGAAQGVQSG